MPSLSQLLKTKIGDDPVTAAAEKAGISFPSFKAVLDNKSVPNARSIDKYAKFLGISAEEVQKASAGATSSRGTGKKRGRPPGKRGPGRPPGKRGPGRPPGMGGAKRWRMKGGSHDASGALAEVGAALKQAEAVLGDDLAMRVHGLSAKSRAFVETILANLD